MGSSFLEGKTVSVDEARRIARGAYVAAWIWFAAALLMGAAGALETSTGLTGVGPLTTVVGLSFILMAALHLVQAFDARRAYWHASGSGPVRL